MHPRFILFFPTCQVRVSRFWQRCNSLPSFLPSSFLHSIPSSFCTVEWHRQLRILWGTPGPECQKECQTECQNGCQIECQKEGQKKTHITIDCQKVCQNRCQIECQKECQIKCQKEYQIFHATVGISRSNLDTPTSLVNHWSNPHSPCNQLCSAVVADLFQTASSRHRWRGPLRWQLQIWWISLWLGAHQNGRGHHWVMVIKHG